MDAVEAAILRTVLYADVFDFPLTLPEIHHFLIHHEPVSLSRIEQALAESDELALHLDGDGAYFAIVGRGHIIGLRREREHFTPPLWHRALFYGRWLARLPFVRMVGLTGALAVHNPRSADDDLDYFVAVEPGRVWLARALCIGLVRLARLRGVELCPNFVVATDALAQARHDLFMAHEVAQVVPLYGDAWYTQFRRANDWSAGQLPNADAAFYAPAEHQPGRLAAAFKRLLECLLSGQVGDVLERWEYRRKLRRFERDLTTPHHHAQLDPSRVKGHFNHHGHPILQRYHERLCACGLLEEAEAGD